MKNSSDFQVAILKQYPKPSDISRAYNPDLQNKIIRKNITQGELALKESIPTLSQHRMTYGDHNTILWLKVQFNSLNEFSGQAHGMNDGQLHELCELVLSQYHWLNMAEICLFIGLFKLGQYGTFYGSIDPLKITSALQTYVRERESSIDSYERNIRNEAQQAQRDQWEKEGISREEYEQLRKKAESGDEEAKRILRIQ